MTDTPAPEHLYLVIREGNPDELVAANPSQEGIADLVEQLGPGYRIDQVPLVDLATCEVVQRWMCRASVVGSTVTTEPPTRMRGASVLVGLEPDLWPDPVRTRVQVDTEASDLDSRVLGGSRHHVTAYADSAQEAERLARARAQQLADSAE